MVRAYLLYTGPDGNSHVLRGSIDTNALINAESIEFKESPPYSTFDWHNAPVPQYVITLAGILEFTMAGGETFILHPGEILVATDKTGSGHKWRLINNEPWRRAYVVYRENAAIHFKADE